MSKMALTEAQAALRGIDLPDDWQLAKFGDLFDIQQGKALNRESRTQSPAFPFLRTANVLWGAVDIAAVDRMNFSDGEREKFALSPGDLLVCEGGEIGRSAIWTGEIEGCYHQNHVHRCRPQGDAVPDFFMFWMLYAIKFRRAYSGHGNTTTIANLSKGRLASLPVPLPPQEEQKAIAKILRAVQRASEETKRVLRGTVDLKASAMNHLFGSTGATDWASEELGDLIDASRPMCYGIVQPGPTQGEGAPFLNVQDLPRVGAAQFELQRTSFDIDGAYSRSRVRTGDLLVGIRGSIGSVAMVPGWLDRVNIARQIARVALMPRISAGYVYYFLQSREAQQFMRRWTKGVAHTGINIRDLKLLPVPVAPKADQERIANVLKTLDRRIDAEQGCLDALNQLFRTLLDGLMTGKTRVLGLSQVA